MAFTARYMPGWWETLNCHCCKVAVSIRHISIITASGRCCRSTSLVLASAPCCAPGAVATAGRACLRRWRNCSRARYSSSSTFTARIPKAHVVPPEHRSPPPPLSQAAHGPPCSWSCSAEDPWKGEVAVSPSNSKVTPWAQLQGFLQEAMWNPKDALLKTVGNWGRPEWKSPPRALQGAPLGGFSFSNHVLNFHSGDKVGEEKEWQALCHEKYSVRILQVHKCSETRLTQEVTLNWQQFRSRKQNVLGALGRRTWETLPGTGLWRIEAVPPPCPLSCHSLSSPSRPNYLKRSTHLWP